MFRINAATVLAVALLCGVATEAQAQTRPETSVIVVIGRGKASAPADYYVIEGRLRGEGRDRVEALAALKAKQDKLFDGMRRLEGGESIRFETGEFSVQAAYPRRCAEDDEDEGLRESGECAPTGFIALLPVEITVRPAAMTGRAGSLAAELGLDDVTLGSGGVDDPARLAAEANRLAFEDAKAQAETLAAAASTRVGRLVRLQDSDARHQGFSGEAVETVVVTGSRIRPKVDITFLPAPVTDSASVTAMFEIGG